MVNTCNSRAIDYFVVSDGLRQAAPAAYTVGDGGFYPQSPVRLLLRGRARAAVVRQLKVQRGLEPHFRMALPMRTEQRRKKHVSSWEVTMLV